jgi:YVTN family beta-propeller protein/YD repeat-containing protein
MKRASIQSLLAALLAYCSVAFVANPANGAPPAEKYLSPTALVATADGKTMFIAGATANEVLFFDVAAGKIMRSIAVPESPLGLALAPDEQRLYVTCAAPESKVCVLDVASGKITKTISAGHTAMSPVFSPEGKTLYVCNRFDNCVIAIDVLKGKEIARIDVAREPVAAAVSPDGKLLFVANHIHAGRSDGDVVTAPVSVINIAERRVVKEIFLPNGSTVLRGIAVSPDGKYVAVTHILARFHLPTTQIERGWINNNALSLIDVAKQERLNTVLLDNVDAGAGNPWAVAWTADGKRICITHAGTHELSLIDADRLLEKLAKVPAKAAGQGYYASVSRTTADVPNDLAFLVGVRNRIKLDGKGPRALALIGNKAYVANYFSDSLSRVDLAANNGISTSIVLGPQPKMSTLRQGEFNFNDASVCFQGWQSCGTCHSSDARVDGMNWDNLNDGIGNPKNVRSLLLAHQTPPAMALGVRSNAQAAVRAGIRNSLFVELPDEFASAIDEYLKSLKPIASPHLVNGKLSKAAERGKKVFFNERVGCAHCHGTSLFTNMKLRNVGTRGQFDQPGDKFDTPTLIELWRTAPYLHDGSAATVREVITTRNLNDGHGSTSHLTSEQIEELGAYLLSL